MTEDVLDLTTDEALLSSLAEHNLEEIKLEPFSLLRQAVSTDLCGKDPGSFFNMVLTVWVCTLSPKEVISAYEDMTQARIKAFEWAEKRGYSLLNFKPLVDARDRINREFAAATRAHVKPSADTGNGEEIPNAGGQPA
jgi:hypothetical protein